MTQDYRRYEQYEPSDVQQPGVYYNRPGAPAADRVVLYYVPPFLSPAFRVFISEFASHPGDNPVFLREWRRHYRRVGGGSWWKLGGVAIGILSALLAVGLLLLLNPYIDGPFGEGLVGLLFFLPSFAIGLLGFFLGLRSCSLAWNRATLQELALTGIGAQEIVFGHLIGGVLPFAIPLVAVLPGIAVLALDMLFRTQLITFSSAFAFVVYFVPNAAASLLCSASIAAALSFSEGDTGRSVAIPIVGWIVVCAAVLGPIYIYMSIGSAGALLGGFPQASGVPLLLGVPVLICAKLLVTGAFLQHLAHRVTSIELE